MAGAWSCVRIVFFRPPVAATRFGRSVVEAAEEKWVTVEKWGGNVRVRAHPGYVVAVSEWFSKDKALLNEVVEALSKPLASVEEFIEAWRAASGSWLEAELEACSDGVIRTPFNGLTWFHGQEDVNRLLEKRGFKLARDYDGVTRAEAVAGRPVTSDKLEKSLKRIAFLLNLYTVIEKVQTAEALKITLAMLKTAPHASQ